MRALGAADADVGGRLRVLALVHEDDGEQCASVDELVGDELPSDAEESGEGTLKAKLDMLRMQKEARCSRSRCEGRRFITSISGLNK